MARLPRYVLPGQPQHLIQRGNNCEPSFAQAADYAFYLEKLKLACEQHTCVIHISAQTLAAICESTNKAWVLGSNRFNAKIETLTKRQAYPKPRGGDRKSKAYRSDA